MSPMKTILTIGAALALVLSPAAAHAEEPPNPGTFYTFDVWPATFHCVWEDGEEDVEGNVLVHWFAEPVSWDPELGEWNYTDLALDPAYGAEGISLDVSPYAEACPYTLGVDPNEASPEEVEAEDPPTDPEPVDETPADEPVDPLGKLGIYAPEKVGV